MYISYEYCELPVRFYIVCVWGGGCMCVCVCVKAIVSYEIDTFLMQANTLDVNSILTI